MYVHIVTLYIVQYNVQCHVHVCAMITKHTMLPDMYNVHVVQPITCSPPSLHNIVHVHVVTLSGKLHVHVRYMYIHTYVCIQCT